MLAITRKKFMIQERRWIKLSVRVSHISTSRYRSSRALAKTRFLRAIDMGKIDWSTTFELCLDSMNLIFQELSNLYLVCFLDVFVACFRSLVCKTEHDCKLRDSSREWKNDKPCSVFCSSANNAPFTIAVRFTNWMPETGKRFCE